MPSPVTFARLDITNQALTAMGESEISDLAGPSKSARVMRQHFDAVTQAAMTDTAWRFNTVKKALNKNTQAPVNRWAASWRLPADHLKTLTTWPPSNYEQMDRDILTNEQTSLELDYQRVVEIGYWPAWFTRYAVARLVMATCKGITGEDPSQAMKDELETAESKAKFADSQQQPNQTLGTNDFIDCRY